MTRGETNHSQKLRGPWGSVYRLSACTKRENEFRVMKLKSGLRGIMGRQLALYFLGNKFTIRVRQNPPPVRQHRGRGQTFAEFTELQTVHCWAAGRWDHLGFRIHDAIQKFHVRGGGFLHLLLARNNSIKVTRVRSIYIRFLNFAHPICYSAVRRGRIVSVRLLRSPVSSDCAFIHSRNMDAPCPVVTPSPAGAWLGVIYHN